LEIVYFKKIYCCHKNYILYNIFCAFLKKEYDIKSNKN
jgi:hypothetical protein